MKNILVLTDFSANAAHAAHTGTMLARHLDANVLLFNANVTQPVVPVYAGGPTVFDEVNFMEKENTSLLQNLAESLKPFLKENNNEKKNDVYYEEGLGDLAYQVKNIIDSRNIEMVVMGSREGSRVDHFLTGSDTFSVIDHSAKPVLIVPHGADLKSIKKVIFATNFADTDAKAIRYLIKLAEIFEFHLEVVHINILGDDDITRDLKKKEFLKHIAHLPHHNLTISEIYGKDIVDRLNNLCNDPGSEILAFSHYKDSFFSRLLSPSTTRKALEKQKAPLLIFPAAFLV